MCSTRTAASRTLPTSCCRSSRTGPGRTCVWQAAEELFDLMGTVGQGLPQRITRLLLLPSSRDQLAHYVRACSKKYLLTEQHLAGGCQYAVDGTGKYKKGDNVFVADLSSICLPRIGPQMTAYIIGHHVAKQMEG
jgi:hypothetical protein